MKEITVIKLQNLTEQQQNRNKQNNINCETVYDDIQHCWDGPFWILGYYQIVDYNRH